MVSESRPLPSSSATGRRWTWCESWALTSRRATTSAAPSRSQRSGPLLRPADPLERDQKGLIGGAGRLLQPDLTGAVAAEVRVVLGAGELGGLLGGRGCDELRMEQAAVTGHAAAGGADRLNDPVGKLAGDLPELPLEPGVAGRAGRVHRDRAELLPDREVRQETLRPGNGVEDFELLVALAILLGQVVGDLAGQPEGARAGVDDDGQPALTAPAPERLDGPVGHQACAV